MAANGAEIIQRYNRLKQNRANFDARWEEMAPYIAPSRVGITSQPSPGEKQTRNVYDSSTMMAAEMMAMFIAGHIINPAQQWFEFKLRDPVVGKMDSVKEWLEECRDRSLMRLSTSMFYAEGPESLIDYGGFGTGFLLTEEIPQPSNMVITGFRGFYFHAEKIGRFVIEEGANGLVDTAMREFELTARVASERWTEEKMPESIKNCLKGEEKLKEKPFKFIHAIIPRTISEQTAGAAGMPWASVWVEKESKTVVHEGGYRVFPASVPRHHRTPGEVYGRGRGDLAFPDSWTLNTAKRMGLEDWALKIRPPVLVRSDSVMGTLRLVPGGPTIINRHGQRIQDVLAPFETGSHPEVSHLNEEELRRSIREIFYVDAIRQLLQVEKSEMTAFEFAKKIELLFRLLGPVYGRLEWEYLHRVIDITFDVQIQAGAFSPPPDEIYQTDGQIDVIFQNPIAKAQRAGDVEALTMAIADLAPLAQLFPQTLDRLDPDKAADGVLDIRGVPAKWQRNDREIIALRAARQEQDERENMLAQMEQVAGAAGKAAPMLKMMSGAQGAQNTR